MLPNLPPSILCMVALHQLQYSAALPTTLKTPLNGIQFKDLEFKIGSAETALSLVFRQSYLENLIIQGKSARANIKKLYRSHDLPPIITDLDKIIWTNRKTLDMFHSTVGTKTTTTPPNLSRGKRNVISNAIGGIIGPIFGLGTSQSIDQINENLANIAHAQVPEHKVINTIAKNQHKLELRLNLLLNLSEGFNRTFNNAYTDSKNKQVAAQLVSHYESMSNQVSQYLYKLFNVIDSPSTAISLLSSEDIKVLEGKQSTTHNGLSLPSDSLLENLSNSKITTFVRLSPNGAELNIMLSFTLFSTQSYKITASCSSSLFLQLSLIHI